MRARSPLGSSLVVSICAHVALGLGLWWAFEQGSAPGAPTRTPPERPLTRIVFLDRAGESAGRTGGGGEEKPTPPRPVQRPGHDHLTVPVASRPDPLAQPTPTPPAPVVGMDIPAVNLAAALDSLPGTIRSTPGAPTDSLGAGKRGGAGEGHGTGDGAERGDSAGRGRGRRGIGEGWYQLGAGVTPPIPLFRGTPRYTPEAVQARVQGSVLVECIVQTTGRCSDFRVVRSMQPPLGLDREAIAAASEWRFKPGLHAGEQVPVLVTIEVAFAIR